MKEAANRGGIHFRYYFPIIFLRTSSRPGSPGRRYIARRLEARSSGLGWFLIPVFCNTRRSLFRCRCRRCLAPFRSTPGRLSPPCRPRHPCLPHHLYQQCRLCRRHRPCPEHHLYRERHPCPVRRLCRVSLLSLEHHLAGWTRRPLFAFKATAEQNGSGAQNCHGWKFS